MARNVINLENVAGYAQYGNDYTNIIEEQRKKKKKQQEKEDSWTDFSAFEDGYQFGDVSKAILGTGVKTAQNFTKGAQSNLEGLLDFGTNVASMGTEALGFDNATKKLRNFAQKDFIAENDLVNKTLINTNPMLALLNQGIGAYENLKNGYDPGDLLVKNNQLATLFKGQGTLSKGIDKIASNSITGNKLDSLAQTVGQISGQAALKSAGIPWQLTAFANSAGSEMNNAFQNNATAGQAFISGLISGAAEVGTEYIGGGLNDVLGMESLGSKALGKFGSKISNKIVSRLAKIGIDASSEGLEEVLSGLGTAFGQWITYANDKEFNELYSSDQALDDFIMGALGTVITNVPGQVQSVRRGENAFSGLTENEQTILDKVIEERTNEAQTDGKELTKKELKKIEDQAIKDLQEGNLTTAEMDRAVGDKEVNVDEKDNYLRRIIENERTEFKLDNDESKNVKSDKQKALFESTKGINNSTLTHRLFKTLNAIQGVNNTQQYKMTTTQGLYEMGIVQKDANGNYVMPDGSPYVPRGLNYKDGVIYVNADVGTQSATQAMYHEVFEGFKKAAPTEYNNFKQMVRDIVGEDAIKQEEAKYAKMYGEELTDDIRDEIINDKFGEIAESEDFLNRIANDRTMFEKFIDAIKRVVNYIKGTPEEKELIKLKNNLEKKFAEAYKNTDFSQNKEVDNTSFSNDIKYSLNSDAIQNLADITGESYSMLEANLGDDEYSVKNYLTRHTKLVDKYMKDNNINVEPVMKPTGLEKHSESYRNFIKDNDLSVLKLAKSEDLLNRYFEEERKEMDSLPENIRESVIQSQKENFNYAKTWDEVPTSLKSYEDEFNLIKNDTKEIVDDWETEKKIQKEVVESPKFQKYLDKIVQPLFHKEAHTVEEVMEEAKNNHGTTDNYEVGAYMTTDGELLDFGDHGYRDDHRTVDAFDLDMNEFMEYGAIRMKPESNGFELAQEPTSEQYSKLYDYIDDYCKNNPDNGDIVVDIDTSRNNYDSQFYNINTPTSKIINDIKTYYETGSFPKQSEFADFRYSLSEAPKQDNKGRELSKDQQEFFKNVAPQLRDENGNIKTFYHGTPSGDFTVFKEGSYFSDRDDYATGYQNTWASSISSGKEATNPKTYEVYLNITNPFTLSNQTAKDIYINEYIKGGNSAYYDPYTDYTDTINQLDEIDWVEGEDLKEWLQENHPEFDGLILDEGGDGGYGEAEYRWRGLSYLPFRSNQIKNIDNLNPTDDPDIRRSLTSNQNITPQDIAPTRGWDIRGRDIALESAIAPLQEQVQQLQSTLDEVKNNIAPRNENIPAISEQEASQLGSRFNENDIAPIRANLTEQESKRLDFLDNLERENMLNDNLAEERNELMEKEANLPTGEDMTPIESLNDVRDMDEVAKDRSANAYQYEHPEVKPYFQEEARVLLAEINEVIPGERFMVEGRDYLHPNEWHGYKRQASEDVANLLDGYTLGTKYTKDQLREGLNAIIEDHGLENKAVSKRLEFMLDDRLRNGYETIEGYHIEPNQEYLNMLREQSWDRYYDEAPWAENAPAEIEEPTIMMTPEEVSRNEVAPVRQDRDIMEMAEQQEFRQNTQKQQPKIQPKPKNIFQSAWDHIMGRWVNRNVLGDRLSRQVNNPQIKYNYDAFNNYMAEAQNNINNFQTNYNFENIGEGLNTIFNEAEKLGIPPAVFNEYLIDQENFDRWKIGKGSKTPAEESAKRLRDYSIQYPQIKKVAQKVWKFGENSLQNRVDAGLMTQEQAEALRNSHPHYVPFFAELENIDKAYEQTNELKAGGLKRAKGGAGQVMPVYEALSKYVNAEKRAIRFNDTLREMIHSIGETNNFGIDERTDSTDISKNLFTDGGNYYITAYEDGKQITARVSKDLYQELARESENRIKQIEDDLALITKPLQKMNEFNRNIHTTLSLSFPLKNAIKDFGSALFNSKHTLGLLKNYLPGAKELVQGKTKDAQQFLAGYGSGLTMGEYRNDTMSQKLKNTKFLRKIANLNNYIELFPRFAEFKASRQAGENMQQALYNAREVTMNFSRGGTVAKAINRDGITFFNTSVQGFDKLIRNFSGENGAKGVALALTKVALLGIAPAVFNDLAFGGGSDDEDEDYKALPNYIKDNYYLIKGSNGEFIRIPKSQPLAVIGSAARRTLEKARGEEDAFEGFTKNAIDQIGVNNPLQNNILAPIIQVNSGKEVNGRKVGTAWYGGDIVPSRLQEESPRNQYDASIDTFSIWLGDKLNISPYKINYVLDQYSGGVGDIGLPLITPEAKNEGGILAPVRDQFVVNSTDDNKYVSKFYSTKEKIPTGKDATEDDILQKKYLDGISKEMSSLYAERREVQADNSLTKKEKYERASEIKREINRLAKEGLDNYQNVKTTGDYSNVNGNEYQKTEDGWKKIKDDVSTEINSYGLTDSEKNTYFKTKSNISGIRDKYKDSKDYASKKADIVNEIRSANLPDDAKIGLYQDAYNDKMAQSYVDAGISADNYLDFKSQTFNADKDKDGKSISGSKKQKVFNYINSMDIPFEQKVILAKTEYPTYNDYNRQVIEYLNNSDIDREEMVDILKDLGFKVNGDNISW